LFRPLGMVDTGFAVPRGQARRLVTTYWVKDGQLTPLDDVHGYPPVSFWYESAVVNSYTASHQRKGGSFGLVSTAEDYWRFAQMILNGGVLEDARILSPMTVNYMSRDHLGNRPMPEVFPRGLGFGLGFAVVKDAGESAAMMGDGTIYWSGAASTRFW